MKVLGPVERLQVASSVEALRFDVLWPPPPAGASLLDGSELADRVRGCIFGAALGDAAGLAGEFLSRQQIDNFYGSGADFRPGRQVYPDEHRMMWPAGDWTDDTDQQILMLQSLLQSGGRADPLDFASRLLAWRERGFQELGDESAAGLGQSTKAVLNDPRFREQPHETAAAHSAEKPTNGGVMRTAVCGIPYFWDEEIVAQNAISLCRTTHAEPRCIASCVTAALCVSRLLQGVDKVPKGDALRAADDISRVFEPAIDRAVSFLQSVGRDETWRTETCEDFSTHANAQNLTELKLDESRTIGYTLKCLGAGLWALRCDLGFRETLNQVIQQGGDADTNGAVAGALLGCRLGYSKLPADWVSGMPYSSWLEAYSQKVLFMLRLR